MRDRAYKFSNYLPVYPARQWTVFGSNDFVAQTNTKRRVPLEGARISQLAAQERDHLLKSSSWSVAELPMIGRNKDTESRENCEQTS
jgi:hypothetical protein